MTLEQPAARVALSRQVLAQAGRAATSPAMVPVVWAAAEAMKARTRAWENCMVAVWLFGVAWGWELRLEMGLRCYGGKGRTAGATGLFIGIRGRGAIRGDAGAYPAKRRNGQASTGKPPPEYCSWSC